MSNTILVVDDEEGIRSSLQGILEDESYQVNLAVDGAEALASLQKELPDLVLLDIWMPGMDGLETLAKIRELYPDLAVVMISGHGTIETAVKSTKLGAYDFIENTAPSSHPWEPGARIGWHPRWGRCATFRKLAAGGSPSLASTPLGFATITRIGAT